MTPDANQQLAGILLVLAALAFAAGATLLVFPAQVRAGLQAFPRSKWPGWALTAAGLFWVAWVVQHAALGRFEGLKPLVPYAGILVFAAMVWLMDELLAPRALGGVLLLLANPVLNAVRWADSAWRFVPAVIAYAWVIAGCAFMLYPWLFRRWSARFVERPEWLRRAGWGKLLAGAVLAAAGWVCLR